MYLRGTIGAGIQERTSVFFFLSRMFFEPRSVFFSTWGVAHIGSCVCLSVLPEFGYGYRLEPALGEAK